MHLPPVRDFIPPAVVVGAGNVLGFLAQAPIIPILSIVVVIVHPFVRTLIERWLHMRELEIRVADLEREIARTRCPWLDSEGFSRCFGAESPRIPGESGETKIKRASPIL